jgi:hypothetical protein
VINSRSGAFHPNSCLHSGSRIILPSSILGLSGAGRLAKQRDHSGSPTGDYASTVLLDAVYRWEASVIDLTDRARRDRNDPVVT